MSAGNGSLSDVPAVLVSEPTDPDWGGGARPRVGSSTSLASAVSETSPSTLTVNPSASLGAGRPPMATHKRTPSAESVSGSITPTAGKGRRSRPATPTPKSCGGALLRQRSQLLMSFAAQPHEINEDLEDEAILLGAVDDSDSDGTSGAASVLLSPRHSFFGGSRQSSRPATPNPENNSSLDPTAVPLLASVNTNYGLEQDLQLQVNNQSLPNAPTSSGTSPGNANAKPPPPAENGLWSFCKKMKHAIRPPMPTRHRHTLSPWEKAIRYRRVPCKMVLTFLLILLLLVQVFLFDINATYADMQERQNFINAFMPSGYQSPAEQNYVTDATAYLYTVDGILDHLRHTTEQYYSLVSTELANLDFYVNTKYTAAEAKRIMEHDGLPSWLFNHSAVIEPPRMTVEFQQESERLRWSTTGTTTITHDLTPDNPLGTFQYTRPKPKYEHADGHDSEGIKPANRHYACQVRQDTVSGEYYLPCRGSHQRSLFDSVTMVTINMEIHQIINAFKVAANEVYTWRLQQRYDLSANGLCTLTLTAGLWKRRNGKWNEAPVLLSFALVIVVIWDFVLRLKVLLRLRRTQRKLQLRFKKRLNEMKAALAEEREHTSSGSDSGGEGGGTREPSYAPATSDQQSSSQQNGTISDETKPEDSHAFHHAMQERLERRLDRFKRRWRESVQEDRGQAWAIYALFVDVIGLSFAIQNISQVFHVEESEGDLYARSILLGVATLLACVMCLSYTRFVPKVYFMIRATSSALPHLVFMLIGIVPVFMGFAVFGTVVFGSYSEQFATLEWSCLTLYSATFGDSLLQMFQAIGTTDDIEILYASRLFGVMYLFIFFWLLLNIALAIVVDSYLHVRERFGLWETKKQERLRSGMDDNESAVNILMNRSKAQVREEAIGNAAAQLRIALSTFSPDDVDDEPAAPSSPRAASPLAIRSFVHSASRRVLPGATTNKNAGTLSSTSQQGERNLSAGPSPVHGEMSIAIPSIYVTAEPQERTPAE